MQPAKPPRSAHSPLSAATAGLSAGVFAGVAPRVFLAANDKLRIACIGTANRAAAKVDGVAGQAIVALCDMGCHYMDPPFWALDLEYPTASEAEGPPVHPEICPLGLTVRYEFPARGDRPPVKFTGYDGNMTPKEVVGQRVPGSGVGLAQARR